MRQLMTITTILLSLMLGGCQTMFDKIAYHPDITQGNVIDDQKVHSLKTGMSRSEVYNIMGTPLINSNGDTVTYSYYHKASNENAVTDSVTITFKDEKVVTVK